VAAFSAAALIVLILLQHRHGPKPPNPSAASGARDSSDELLDDSPPAERDPEAGGSAVAADGSTCATVERMGEEAAGAGRGSPEQASLRVREMIQRHFELHGAFRSRRGRRLDLISLSLSLSLSLSIPLKNAPWFVSHALCMRISIYFFSINM
jgi:hypothetical protein